MVINLEKMRVHDHSGLEALQNIIERYAKEGKKIYLHQVSPECKQLIEKADNIVEVTTIDDVNWHIATDKLG